MWRCVFLLLVAVAAFAQDKKSECGLEYSISKGSGGGGRAPLVIMLHGTGGNRALFGAYEAEARKRGFIIVKPKSTGTGTPQSGNSSGDNLKRWDFVDEPKVVALTREIVKKEGADPKRVYLMGFSNGAWFTSEIGLSNPDLFAGICVIGGGCAGTPWSGKEELAREMGVYIIHGTADTSVGVDNARSMEKRLKDAGFKNVIYKEYPNREHELFDEEVKNVFDLWAKCVKKFKPGSNKSIEWKDKTALAKTNALIYFFSPKDDASQTAEQFETELFVDPTVLQACKTLVCVKVDREDDLAKQYKVKAPTILLVNAEGKQVATFTSSTGSSTLVAKIKVLNK